MESSRADDVSLGYGTSGSINIKELFMGFAFPTLPLTNHEHVGNSKQKRNAQTYITTQRHSFGCDSTYNKLCVGQNHNLHAYTKLLTLALSILSKKNEVEI